MLLAFAVLTLAAADMQPMTTFSRADTPRTRAQREADEAQAEADRADSISQGERSGDGGNLDRLICDWRRIPGSNRRERVCQTAGDRRATRDIARETLQQMQGSVTTDPEFSLPPPGAR